MPFKCSLIFLAVMAGTIVQGLTINRPRDLAGFTVSDLLEIAPSASSCVGATYPDECMTALDALPHILASFERYDITHNAVKAALVALMAYESGEFRYNKSHFPAPGVPGQGTRNMQSPAFNQKYALWLGLGTIDDMDDLITQLGQPSFSFASAAWFVAEQCPMSARTGMWDGSQAGWEAYLTSCVGADLSEPGRWEYWQRATAVFM